MLKYFFFIFYFFSLNPCSASENIPIERKDKEKKQSNSAQETEEIETIKTDDAKQHDNVLIESFFSKKDDGYLFFEKDVSIRKSDLFLETEKLEVFNINKRPITEKNKGNDFSLKDKILFSDQPFKVIMDDGTFIYGNRMMYNTSEFGSYSKNVQLFPGDDGVSVLSKEVRQIDEENLDIKHCIMSSCVIADKKLIEQREDMKENGIYKLESVQEPEGSLVYRDGYDKTRWSYLLTPWSISATTMIHNKTKEMIYMYNAIFRIGPIPVFYYPYMYFTIKKDGAQSGFLPPKFVSLGRLQQGIEIPLYFRISDNIDFTFSRSQYFSIPGLSNPKEISLPASSLDSNRMRESTFGFDLRHLLSLKHGFESYYRVRGLLTDRTQVLNNNSLVSLDDNGNPIKGYRGYFEVKSFIALSEKTFIDIDYIWTSDRNFLYIYKMYYAPYLRNKIQIRHVDENTYHSFELVEYKELLMRFPTGPVPKIMPVFRSIMKKEENYFGGRFFYDFQGSYIDRSFAFKHLEMRLKAGYELIKNFDNGFRLNLNFVPYIEYHHLRTSTVLGSELGTSIEPNYIGLYGLSAIDGSYSDKYTLGNYAYIYNNQQYLGYNLMNNYTRQGFQSNVTLSYPLFSYSKIGYSIIEPKVGLRFNQTFFNTNTFLNDTAYLYRLNYNNFFQTFRSNGLSIYDYGLSPYAGLSFNHQFQSDISLNIAGAVQYTVFNNLAGFSTSYSGLPSIGLSSFVGSFAIRYKNLSYTLNYRLNLQTAKILEANQYITGSVLNGSIMLGITSLYLAREASFFNREIFNASIFTRIFFTKRIYLQSSFAFNFSKEPIPGYISGKIGPTIAMFSLVYMHDCFLVGLSTSINFFAVGGIPPIPAIGVKFQPKISFDTKIEPGSRKLPNDNFTEEDL